MSGGIANTMVTIVAGSGPMPKKKMIGSMYTNEWTTCMASSTGRTAFHTPSMRPHRTPRGMPIRAQSTTATTIMPSVSAVSSQYSMPSIPQPARARATKAPTLTLRTSVPIAKKRMHTAIHGMSVISHQGWWPAPSTKLRNRKVKGHSMMSSAQPRLRSIQRTICSTHSPKGMVHWSRTLLSATPGVWDWARKLT